MGRYHDHRDVGALTLSHLYLLLGCAAPIWWLFGALGPRFNTESGNGQLVSRCGMPDDSVAPLGSMAFLQAAIAVCGLVSVGVADATAAVVGVTMGRRRFVT